ncbi:tRNA endonuclease ANKZF1-like [Neocloeon triangulifer]|uniref:tRNA endonuclease ANKZF1-like n=1 Tax=Neocloeon triangulifer TaxID=2078957 RepID=UPI00286ED9ED|nr:tRNA endonuclease ANKZF1-like [Neocloeon triangulifer]
MDELRSNLKQLKKYEVHNIFDSKDFNKLVSGIRLADCMKAEVSYVTENVETEDLVIDAGIELSISDSLTCSYCSTSFENKTEQRNHYKLDWHRHNLKLSLKGLKGLKEEDFDKLNDDDVSSISGSESETSSEDEEAKVALAADIELTKTIRHPKVFFVNEENKILSLYRCILHGKENPPNTNEELFKLAQNCQNKSKWAIIMLGGGHFAAAIFEGKNVMHHKTFHSYTVRAKQGGSQGARDSKSGTSHPRSAGASLRRYNEQSFQQHINDLLEVWKEPLSKCDFIFLRAVSHNRTLIFTGKNSLLQKNNPRIRSIPFPTRRATFKEVQRVHDLLSSLEVYGSAEEFMEKFPTSPNKKQERESPPKESSPEAKPKKKIERDKSRASPCRPLPEVVEKLAESSEEGSLIAEDDELIMMTSVLDVSRDLLEYDDDVPEEEKQRGRRQKRRPKKKKKKEKENCEEKEQEENAESLSDKGSEWKALLFSSRHDTKMMSQIINDMKNIEEEEKILIIHSAIDVRGNNLLHEASNLGLVDRVRFLLESGLDPSVSNREGRVPFRVAKDTETRKIFRRFQAEFPNKYDYSKAEVPGPLTDEIEKMENEVQAQKKNAKRNAKKEKLVEKKKLEAEKRKEDEERRKEQEEKDRFLKLSEREKCALAAERRLMAAGGQVVVRCFVCASDMSGKVPFCYQAFKFCSMECLKAHRFQSKPSS